MEVVNTLFEELPLEINFWIESFFDQECRLRARLISKKWFQLINNSHFDIYMPEGSQMLQIIETFSRCTHPFSLKFHKSDKLSTKPQTIGSSFTKLTNLTGLEFSTLYTKTSSVILLNLDLPEQLQRIEGPVGINVTSSMVQNLVHLDTYQITFASDQVSLTNLDSFASNNFPSSMEAINETKLTALHPRYFQIDTRTNDKLNRFTNLKVLKIGTDVNSTNHPIPLTLTMPNLEVLEVLGLQAFNLVCESTRLTSLTLKTLPSESIKTSALKSFTILPGQYQPTNITDSNLTVLKNMPNLEELNLRLQENGLISAKFLRFMNERTLTKLSTGLKGSTLNEISPFTNLRELNLVLQNSKMEIESLSNLSQLTKLSIGGTTLPYMEWLNSLTKLRELCIDFKTPDKYEVPLDVADLIQLRTLVVSTRTNKIISSLRKLTRLEKLEFPMAKENIFDDLIFLTSLSFYQAPFSEQVTKLTRLRELNCIVITNDEIIQLSSLLKLTKFICRSVTADYHTLTLLTSLQSVSFSNKVSLGDWSTAQPWSNYNAYPDVARKLPNLLYGPKDSSIPAWLSFASLI